MKSLRKIKLVLFISCFILSTSIYAQTYWNKIEVDAPHVMRYIYMDSTFEKGWIIGNNRMILRSEDGGLTWDSLSTENIDPAITVLSEMTFSNDSTMWIAGSLYYGTGGPAGTVLQKGKLFKSVDEGVTLEEIEFEYPGPGNSPYGFWSIDFINDQIGWIVGYNRLYKTINGGETWDHLGSFVECCDQVQFVTETIGWVSGDKKVYKSVDGGETWSEIIIEPQLEEPYIEKIQLLNENEGWVVVTDEDRKLYKTDDGGGNFNFKSSFEHVIFDFHFVDSNEGWLIVYSGEIYHTTDGGMNWEIQNEGEENSNNRVIHVDRENGVILNPDGFILRRDSVYLTNTFDKKIKEDLISVNPNPAKDKLTLINKTNSIINRIELYNLRGVRLQKREIAANSEIDISLLSDGLYLIVGYTDSGFVFAKKFIKT